MHRHLPLQAWLGLALLVLIPAFLISCGSDGVTPENPGPGTTNLTINMVTHSGLPGTKVAINGIPETLDLTGIYAAVTDPTAGKSAGTVAQVGRSTDGTPFLAIPLVPSDPAGGGPIAVTLAGDHISSNTVEMTVLPLPAATVTVQEYVTSIQAVLTTWLAYHGTSREALRAMDPATMPGLYWPLWYAHEVLDSPDNPNSLRKLVDGPIPHFNDEVIDFDIVNRLLSQTDAMDFLASEVDSIGQLVIPPSVVAYRENRGDHAGPQLDKVAGCIPPGEYAFINDAASLDAAMNAGRFGARRIEGASGKVLGDIGGVVGLAGLVPQLKPAATAVGAGLNVFTNVSQAAANMLPTSFDYGATDYNLAGNRTKYFEDAIGGSWSAFKVTAISQGWALDKDVLTAMLEIANLSDLGGLDNALPGLDKFGEELTGYLVTLGTNTAIGAATQGGSILNICPNNWRGIDVSGPGFCESLIAQGSSIAMTSHQGFETKEPGVSKLRVRTLASRFGGAPPAVEDKELEVQTITVTVVPAQTILAPDQSMLFTATVTHANDTTVDWTVPSPLIELSRTPSTIQVKAPPEGTTWTSPVQLRARSQADKGAREGKVDTDPRDGFALVLPGTGNIIVGPGGVCVPLDGNQTFFASVTGLENKEVIWTASEGHFEGNIYYPPPYEVPEVTITATSVANPSVSGSVTVEVSDCTCWWTATVTGEETGSWEGIKSLWEDEFVFAIHLTPDDDNSNPAISVGIEGAFNGPGTYEAIAVMIIGDNIYASEENPDAGLTLAELQIFSVEGTTLTGRARGKLTTWTPVEPYILIIDLDVQFRAENLSQVDPCHIPGK